MLAGMEDMFPKDIAGIINGYSDELEKLQFLQDPTHEKKSLPAAVLELYSTGYCDNPVQIVIDGHFSVDFTLATLEGTGYVCDAGKRRCIYFEICILRRHRQTIDPQELAHLVQQEKKSVSITPEYLCPRCGTYDSVARHIPLSEVLRTITRGDQITAPKLIADQRLYAPHVKHLCYLCGNGRRGKLLCAEHMKYVHMQPAFVESLDARELWQLVGLANYEEVTFVDKRIASILFVQAVKRRCKYHISHLNPDTVEFRMICLIPARIEADIEHNLPTLLNSSMVVVLNVIQNILDM